jgi:uncharacterized protein (TIGR02996 family)
MSVVAVWFLGIIPFRRLAMSTEADFRAKLQADPADDATRLVYADWLEERGDAGGIVKVEFLRLTR